MATQMQLRGGTTAENLLFTGAQREVTVDTDLHALVVHDGVTAGGYRSATYPQVANGTFYFNDDVAGGSAANAYILVPKTNTNTPTMYTDGLQLGFTTANPNTGQSTASFQGLGVKLMKYRGGADPAAGDINGRVYLIYDMTNDWFEIQLQVKDAPPQIRSIQVAVSSNTLVMSILPQVFTFRSTTQGSGATNTRNLVAQANLTAPAGATLGTTNGVAATLVILAIEAPGGAVEVAVANAASGFVFDESTPISTTAISAAATSASVIYSATARAAVSYRVAGYMVITEAAAGTWTTAPTKVQGEGGNAVVNLAMQALGVGQTWQVVTGSRVSGTTYTNSTGRPIMVRVVGAGSNQTITSSIGGVALGVIVNNNTASAVSDFYVVPSGATYSSTMGAGTILSWAELR